MTRNLCRFYSGERIEIHYQDVSRGNKDLLFAALPGRSFFNVNGEPQVNVLLLKCGA